MQRSGRHWVVAAVGMLASPVLLGLAAYWQSALDACTRAHGGLGAAAYLDKHDGFGACSAQGVPYSLAVVGFWGVLAGTTAAGLAIGLVAGRRRRRFAHGRWLCAMVIGVTGPWALAAYSLTYWVGRLLPAATRASEQVTEADWAGWQHALELYRRLDAGLRPPCVLAPGWAAEDPVYLDAQMHYARYYGTDVSYGHSSVFAFGRPAFVAGAVLGSALGNAAAARRARQAAQSQWREHREVRVVLTSTATMCCVNGRWLAFDHAAVVEYHLTGPVCVLTFVGSEPLLLSGPSAWCHAVLFAYLRRGQPDWCGAPYLRQINQAAGQGSAAAASDR